MFRILVYAGACVSAMVCVCALNGLVGQDLVPQKYGNSQSLLPFITAVMTVNYDEYRQ